MAGPEICRGLGEAKGQFDKLAKVWRLFTLRTQQKIRILQTYVVSKLLHCLQRMWLKKAELETYCRFFYKGFFFSSRSFLTAKRSKVQGCFTGQPPGTDCFYTGQSPDVLVVGKV